MSTSARADRAVGALVGLAVGDAVGTALEFKTPGSFAPITDMVGGGPFGLRAGQWTDDTAMAMCLAESIVDRDELDPADQLRRYVMWWRDGYWSSTGRCFDIGSTTIAGLSRFVDTGTVTDFHIDENKAANGSLMRLAGVPIRWSTDRGVAADRSADSSRTTHPAPRPVDACFAMGWMLAALIDGDDIFIAERLAEQLPRQVASEVADVLDGSWRLKSPPDIRGTGYCIDALEAALWAVGHADGFESAVLAAANLGDDADTTAAIAGQLAGARWGYSAIPEHWRSKITSHDRIVAIARRLHELSIGAANGSPGSWPHDDLQHAYWVTPGELLAGEYPGNADPAAAAETINLLVDAGVRTFVDLTQPVDGLAPYSGIVDDIAAKRVLDLRHVAHPVPDMGVIESSGYDEILQTIESASAHGAVYVHCWGGIGRTGTVIGCWLIEQLGCSAATAIERIFELRAGTGKAYVESPQTPVQRELLQFRAGG